MGPPSSRPGSRPPSFEAPSHLADPPATVVLSDAEDGEAVAAAEAAEGEDDDASPRSQPAPAQALRENDLPEADRLKWLPYIVLSLLVFLGLASFLGTLLR